MRATEALSVIEVRLAGLVHQSVEDRADRCAQERFIASRMVTGCLGLALLPPYLLWRGSPSTAEVLGAACIAAPAFAAFVVARTARLELGHALSSLALAGLIGISALSSPTAGWAALLLLAAVPLEALLSGSRRALAGSLAAAAFMAFAGGLTLWGSASAGDPSTPGLPAPMLALVGLAHLAGHVLVHGGGTAGAGSVSRALAAHERSLLGAVEDLVTWHDRNGDVIRVCAGAARLLGVSESSLRGKGLLAHVHVSDRPAFLRAVSEAACSDRPVVLGFRLHRGGPGGAGPNGPDLSGGVIWAEMRAHRGKSGAEPAVLVLARGISAPRLEADLRSAPSSESVQHGPSTQVTRAARFNRHPIASKRSA